jgi:hypothetical protein
MRTRPRRWHGMCSRPCRQDWHAQVTLAHRGGSTPRAPRAAASVARAQRRALHARPPLSHPRAQRRALHARPPLSPPRALTPRASRAASAVSPCGLRTRPTPRAPRAAAPIATPRASTPRVSRSATPVAPACLNAARATRGRPSRTRAPHARPAAGHADKIAMCRWHWRVQRATQVALACAGPPDQAMDTLSSKAQSPSMGGRWTGVCRTALPCAGCLADGLPCGGRHCHVQKATQVDCRVQGSTAMCRRPCRWLCRRLGAGRRPAQNMALSGSAAPAAGAPQGPFVASFSSPAAGAPQGPFAARRLLQSAVGLHWQQAPRCSALCSDGRGLSVD